MAIKYSQESLEFTPSFSIGNYGDSFADMLTKSGRLDDVTALHRSQHRKDNRATLATPHNMILELVSEDSRTWNRRNINEWQKLFKL